MAFAGNAAITYNAPLKKCLLSVTDGWPTTAKMNSYILESDRITGPYKLVTYLRDFGASLFPELPFEVHQRGWTHGVVVLFEQLDKHRPECQ